MKRNWHHYETWECVPAGMYETIPPKGYSADSALVAYTEFLGDLKRFEAALKRVIKEWPVSCEQFLANHNINRIAWLGQSSMCMDTGVPAKFRAGFAGLSGTGQHAANMMAEKYLLMWEESNGSNFQDQYWPSPVGLHRRIRHYLATWTLRGYSSGIPDEVPPELMRLNLAPSHKAVALAILRNDHACASLGYSQPISPWYGVIKKLEIEKRNTMEDPFFN